MRSRLRICAPSRGKNADLWLSSSSGLRVPNGCVEQTISTADQELGDAEDDVN